MYKLLCYNDDCILDTSTNTVVFKSEKEYTRYEDWARVYIKENNLLVQDKIAEVNHNKGLPVYTSGPNNTSVESLYNEKGHLFSKKVFYDKECIEEHKFTLNPNLPKNAELSVYRSTYYEAGEKVRENIYFPNGNPQQRVMKYSTEEGNFITTMLYHANGMVYIRVKYRNNKLYSYTKYNVIGNKTQTIKYHKNGKLKESITYFASNGNLHSEIELASYKFNSKGIDYLEYYNNKGKRASGRLTSNYEMDGEWNFYHLNGLPESKYMFDKGEIVEGKIYHEDGNLIAEI